MFNKFTRRLATPPHRSPGLICIISQFYCVTSLGTIFSERSPSLALAHSQPPPRLAWTSNLICFPFMYILPLLSGAFCKVLWKFYMQYNVIKESWQCLEGLSYDFPTSYNFLFRNSCVLHISIQLIALHQITMASNIGANNTSAESKLDVGAIRKEKLRRRMWTRKGWNAKVSRTRGK